MGQRRHYVPVICFVVLLLALVGCGYRQGNNATNAGTATGLTPPAHTLTATPQSSTPTTSAAQTPTPLVSTPTPKGTVTPSSVLLTLSKTHYTPSETIVVTVLNGLSTTISTSDHQSGCTIVALQEQTSNGIWQSVDACRTGIATRIVTLPAQSSQVQQLSPSTGTFARGATWPKGTYRIAFTFTTGQVDMSTTSFSSSSTVTAPIYSPTFVIN